MSEFYPSVSHEWQEQTNYDEKYVLYMYISTASDIKNQYVERINLHNQSLQENTFMDSGFDILVTEDQNMVSNKVNKIDWQTQITTKYREVTGNEYIYLGDKFHSDIKMVHFTHSMNKPHEWIDYDKHI